MFGFLKKKIGDFASKVTKKAEEKIEEEVSAPEAATPQGPIQPEEAPIPSEPVPQAPKPPEPKKEERKPEPKPVAPPEPVIPPVVEAPKPKAEAPAPKAAVLQEPKKEVGASAPEAATPQKPKLGFVTRLKQAVASEITLSEKEIDDFMWEFELALLEADVAQPVAEEIIASLKKRLAETSFSRGKDVHTEIESAVRETLKEIISLPGFDLLDRVKQSEKPFIIMFLGPNGAGKTTTLAKIASMLKKNGVSTVFAASDTFRAASIEQLQHHADALGIKMVKHDYGADPAAVAFDTIKSAKARGIDCVLIDTAGRQDTNKNLMEELKKIKRVANPHVLVYLDEALAGNALLDRVEQFKSEIGVDGVILSKMDMDVKGGGVISIARSTGVPIIYYGTGQSYDDLEAFDADALLDRIFG